MKSQRLIGNAAASAMQALVSAAALFLIYRYLLQELGSEQLGAWAILLASTSVGKLAELGVSAAVVRFVVRDIAVSHHQRAVVRIETALLASAITVAMLAIGAYPLIRLLLKSVTSGQILELIIYLLPISLISLWIGILSNIALAGLDGVRQVIARNILLISGNILYLLCVLSLVPVHGLWGVAYAQCIQGAALCVGGWLLLRRHLGNLNFIPMRFSFRVLKEMLRYAINFQIAGVAALLVEPATKIFLAKYAGLSSVAFYEMASQVVSKARALFIAVLQGILPELARLKPTDLKSLKRAYEMLGRITKILVLGCFHALIFAMPFISEVWIERIESDLVAFGRILLLGTMLSFFALPAYYMNLAVGRPGLNTVAQILVAGANLVLGYSLGKMFGGIGVVLGAAIASVIGHWILLLVTQRWLNFSARDIEFRASIAAGLSWALFLLIAALRSGGGYSGQSSSRSVAEVATYCVGMVVILWATKTIQQVRIDAARI